MDFLSLNQSSWPSPYPQWCLRLGTLLQAALRAQEIKASGNMNETSPQLDYISLWRVKVACFFSPLLSVISLCPHTNYKVCQFTIIPISKTKILRWENKARSDAVGNWQDQDAFSTSSLASTFSQPNVFMISIFQLII